LIDIKKFKPSKKKSDLTKEIDRLFALAADAVPGTARYDQIAKLYKLKDVDSKSRVSRDVMVGALTNLTGIVIIVNHEHLHAITSKALGFVGKNVKL
jgi:hypothetical protein